MVKLLTILLVVVLHCVSHSGFAHALLQRNPEGASKGHDVSTLPGGRVVRTVGSFGTIVTNFSISTYTPSHVGEEDCQAWKPGAWPLTTYLLYEGPNCQGGGRRFTKCAEYGDHWTAGRYICQGAADMHGNERSMRITGGRVGLVSYVLMDDACPPPGDNGIMGTMDPGNGKCLDLGLEEHSGVTVRNVDRAGKEISGHTRWLDSEALNSRRSTLGKRQPKCGKFVQDKNKDSRPTRTRSVNIGVEAGPCAQDHCSGDLIASKDVSRDIGGSVTTSTNMIFVTVTGEFHYDVTRTFHKQINEHYDIGRGESVAMMCDSRADMLFGHWEDCDDGSQPGDVVLKPAEDKVECRLVKRA